MKITITGSLGYIGKPLAEKLVAGGHQVTIISSDAAKENQIRQLGARPAIGSMEDSNFLTEAFSGAEAVYCMLAPYGDFSDPENDAEAIKARAGKCIHNYRAAIETAGIKRVVYLSSMGADHEDGVGLISVHQLAEQIINGLPADVSISFIRPAGFYKNLLGFAGMVKYQGVIATGYGGDDNVAWVSNLDIADAIVEELVSGRQGRRIRYVVSEETSCNELAGMLGQSIGKPDLRWIRLSQQAQLEAFTALGMNESVARNFVEMNESIQSGRFYEDYRRCQPLLGKVKLRDFAPDFAAAFEKLP